MVEAVPQQRQLKYYESSGTTDMEFPRYISAGQGQALAPGASAQLQSQTITLPTIPDLLIIYVKPVGGYTIPAVGQSTSAGSLQSDYQQGDWYLSIGSPTAGSTVNYRPLNINFDNFSGLLSSVTVQELYNMSVKNGLDMDWAAWSGLGVDSNGAHITPNTATPGTVGLTTRAQGGKVPLVGSILVLKPSQDITLQSGQAPSLVGNFTLQFNLQVWNQSDFTVTPQLYVITANSGFFESIRGMATIHSKSRNVFSCQRPCRFEKKRQSLRYAGKSLEHCLPPAA